MGERKVLNKYYPADFNPGKIPRRRQPKNHQMKVRTMLPMSIRCLTCGAYLYKGTKFNSRKEDAVGEEYLGIQIFRFYSKCANCSAEFTFKTDPRNLGYVIESGAEPWRSEVTASRGESEEEVNGDAMKLLEKKAADSKKKDMDLMLLAALEEMTSRRAMVTFDSMLLALQPSLDEEAKQLEAEDALVGNPRLLIDSASIIWVDFSPLLRKLAIVATESIASKITSQNITTYWAYVFASSFYVVALSGLTVSSTKGMEASN